MKYGLILTTLSFLSIFSGNLNAQNNTETQSSTMQFLRNQITNSNELLVDASVLALIDVTFGDVTKYLGKNPNAKLIIRDFCKIFGLITNVEAHNEIARTGYFYDESHYYAHAAKIATKLGAFFALLRAGTSPESAAVLANIPGDSVGRLLVIAGMIKQDLENSDEPFYSFLYNNMSRKWIWDTLSQQMLNLPSMHILGTLAGKYEVGVKLQTFATWVLPTFLSHGVNPRHTISENTASQTTIPGTMRVFTVMMIASAFEKLVFSFSFPPISRVMMAFGAWAKSAVVRDEL